MTLIARSVLALLILIVGSIPVTAQDKPTTVVRSPTVSLKFADAEPPYGLENIAQVQWLADTLGALRVPPLTNNPCTLFERERAATFVDYAPGWYYKFEVVDKLHITDEETERILSDARKHHIGALVGELRKERIQPQKCSYTVPEFVLPLSGFPPRTEEYKDEYELVSVLKDLEDSQIGAREMSFLITHEDVVKALARYANRERLVAKFVKNPVCSEVWVRLENIVLHKNVPMNRIIGMTQAVKNQLSALEKKCGG